MKAKLLAAVLIASGVILGIYGTLLVRERYLPIDLNIKSVHAQENVNYPIRLEIPSINLILPISTANIKNGKWDNPNHTVGYWIDSPLPGKKGNSVFYGHNWPTIFGNLNKIKTGETIRIIFEDGQTTLFTVNSKNTVTPDQTHILEQTEDTRITLYTCTGFLDTKRLVVVAILN